MFLLLFNQPNVDLTLVDKEGKSVLHYACECDTGRSFLISKIMETGKFTEKEKQDCENEKYWKSRYKAWVDPRKAEIEKKSLDWLLDF